VVSFDKTNHEKLEKKGGSGGPKYTDNKGDRQSQACEDENWGE